MIIKKLSCFSYRNLENTEIFPSEYVNIFYGDNAQGKTNLLESLWILTGAKPFRTWHENELVKLGNDAMKIETVCNNRDKDYTISLKYSAKTNEKVYSINGIDADPARISEVFSAVIFSPEHLSIIKKGPEERRSFVDTALCQLRPGCTKLINEYKKAVVQRNNILKDYSIIENYVDLLDVFEDAIAKSGAELTYQRKKYCEKLNEVAGVFYQGLSSGKEKLSINYKCYESEDRNEISELILKELKTNREKDIHTGYTTMGPHRHDIEILINGNNARFLGSQGQQRSAALSMKLAEAEILESFSGSRPIALLDDVMSELDIHRQKYILNKLEGWQVFVTSCDNNMPELKNGIRMFNIKNGVIDNVSDSK